MFCRDYVTIIMFSLACVLGEERGYCCRRNWQVRVGEGMCVQNVELITCVFVYTKQSSV